MAINTIEEENELNPLVQEFSDLCERVQKEIDNKVAQAHIILKEAEMIAEAHGVPFSSRLSPIRNSFVPKSFSKGKFSGLNDNEVCEASGVYGEYIGDMLSGYGGWLHSAVC